MGKRKRSSKQDSCDTIDAIEKTESHKDKTAKKHIKKDNSKIITADTEEGISIELLNDAMPEKVKKKPKKLDPPLNEEDNQTEEVSKASIPTKAKKVRKKHFTNDSDTNKKEKRIKKNKNQIKPISESSIEITEEHKSTGTVMASKGSNSNTSVINKKIIFADDDEPLAEVSSTNKGNKSKSFLNEEEANVKDEDIDKFCDELGDDDNLQYENWVQLIEAKLHSGSKKGK